MIIIEPTVATSLLASVAALNKAGDQICQAIKGLDLFLNYLFQNKISPQVKGRDKPVAGWKKYRQPNKKPVFFSQRSAPDCTFIDQSMTLGQEAQTVSQLSSIQKQAQNTKQEVQLILKDEFSKQLEKLKQLQIVQSFAEYQKENQQKVQSYVKKQKDNQKKYQQYQSFRRHQQDNQIVVQSFVEQQKENQNSVWPAAANLPVVNQVQKQSKLPYKKQTGESKMHQESQSNQFEQNSQLTKCQPPSRFIFQEPSRQDDSNWVNEQHILQADLLQQEDSIQQYGEQNQSQLQAKGLINELGTIIGLVKYPALYLNKRRQDEPYYAELMACFRSQDQLREFLRGRPMQVNKISSLGKRSMLECLKVILEAYPSFSQPLTNYMIFEKTRSRQDVYLIYLCYELKALGRFPRFIEILTELSSL